MNQNEIRKIASLKLAKYRREYGKFLAEGIHSVTELLKSDWQVDSLIATPEALESGRLAKVLQLASERNIKTEIATARQLEKMAATKTPQGVMAVTIIPAADLKGLEKIARIVVADGIADPGNLGTIIRTAAAFGFRGFITTPGSADIFGDKAVRATQGALFSVIPFNHLESAVIIRKLKRTHKFYALMPRSNTAIGQIKAALRSALIVGAEAAGVSKELLEVADSEVSIPMSGPIESLNAAVSAGIAMFELSR
jgi:TrmH family RNA methyltransferase